MQQATTEDARTAATIAAIERFNDAFNRHDVDGVMAAMTDDCIFEGTSPPDGQRFEGQAAVRAVWEGFFSGSPQATFETEEMFAARRPLRRAMDVPMDGEDGTPGHVRGVDLFQVRDEKVAAKLAYVKG